MRDAYGKHWLLLRGLSRESAHWGDFPELLRLTFPQSQISTLDLPGSGSRNSERCPMSIARITDAVRQQAIRQNLLQQPLTVLALSMGGMIAWEWMLKYPEDICAGALINVSLASLSPFYKRMHWRNYPDLLKLLALQDPLQRELTIVRRVTNLSEKHPALAERWEQIHRARPVGRLNSLRQIAAAASYRPEAGKPQSPILLLNSRGDRLVDPDCSVAIQRRWQLQLETHLWGGHDLTSDDGPWVVNTLQAWLRKLQTEAAAS